MTRPPKSPNISDKERDKYMEYVFECLSNGQSVIASLKEKSIPVTNSMFYRWLRDYPDEYKHKYEEARETQCHYLVDECLQLIDESSSDIAVDEFGNIKENHKTVARAKAQVDTRFRFLEKMTPRVYGAKKAIEMSGSVDGEYKVSGLEIVFKDEEEDE